MMTNISIDKVSIIYHGSPYEMQTEMSRGPLAEGEHSRKEIAGGLAGLRPASPPAILFCRGHTLPSPSISVCISYWYPWLIILTAWTLMFFNMCFDHKKSPKVRLWCFLMMSINRTNGSWKSYKVVLFWFRCVGGLSSRRLLPKHRRFKASAVTNWA